VGREPRQGQHDLVEVDPDLAAAGQADLMAADFDAPETSAPIVAGASTSQGAIELRGLTKRYGNEAVVNAVTVSIAPGEFFSLLSSTRTAVRSCWTDRTSRLCRHGSAASAWCSRTTRSFHI
jgi:hypothetical protein